MRTLNLNRSRTSLASLAILLGASAAGQACNPAELQKLTPSDGQAGDNFASSSGVALDGDTLLVGSRYHIGDFFEDGAAYIYRDTGAGWVEEQKLVASDPADEDWFGWAVGLDGDTAMVGAFLDDDQGENSGSVYVYQFNGTAWVQTQKLLASDGLAGGFFGRQIEIDGDRAIIGAWTADVGGIAAGKTYIFRNTGTTWVEEAVLVSPAPAEGIGFGGWVSISGNHAAIGEPFASGTEVSSGKVHLFEFNGSSWNPTQTLTAPTGETPDSVFGNSVQLSGDTLVVASVYENDFAGAAYVYRRTGSYWAFEQKLTASDPESLDLFGYVSVSENLIAVGARWDDDAETNAGAVYLFEYNGSAWTQTHKLTSSTPQPSDQFGWAVSISGDTLAIGATSDNTIGADAGAAYIFTLGCPQPCPADTNNDGDVTPADFGAWIAAFNTQSPACDQNGDALCTPADFGAWITNFNRGCP